MLFRVIILSFFIFSYNQSYSQPKRTKINEDYINNYKNIAIGQMKKHKIPASITLAQGILESGAAKSELAKKSNNHFGIKCHNDWTGSKVYHNDDARGECFRKYKKVEESYEDHSKFLIGKPRYAALFNLKITDYRNWAKGLQKAGYATNKAYANLLIKLIEDYELYQYDDPKLANKYGTQNVFPHYKHTPYRTHNMLYIVANDGDNYEDIAKEFGFKVKDLCKWNEIPRNYPLKKGELVYFEKKKNKAQKPYYLHTVRIGESMYSIAQLYGIKVKNLYKMNKVNYEYVPSEGDVLKLR